MVKIIISDLIDVVHPFNFIQSSLYIMLCFSHQFLTFLFFIFLYPLYICILYRNKLYLLHFFIATLKINDGADLGTYVWDSHQDGLRVSLYS